MVKVNEAEKFKHVFKEALTETFQEQRDLCAKLLRKQLKISPLPRRSGMGGKLLP
jgi:hypothetical protein